MKIVVKRLEYQRNGISGRGFYSVDLNLLGEGVDETDLIAVLSVDDNGDLTARDCYVVTPSNTGQHWRGDHFGDLLVPWIEDNSDAAFPVLYPDTVDLFPVTLNNGRN